MRKKIIKNMEWGILVCSVLLLAIGIVALFSATQNSDYEEFKKQIIWFFVSIPIMIIVILIDYDTIAKISIPFYVIFLFLLVAVLFTKPVNGATSWFSLGSLGTFQPAEFAKIFVIIFTSYIITRLTERGKERINKPWVMGIVLLTIAIPVLLIVKQPDIGTAVAYIVALAFMIFAAGLRAKYIIITVLLVIILVPILYFTILPEHAKSRIDIFLNPEKDPRGAGYNIIQSKLAIGAGQLLGMGILKGNQTQLGFLYPKTTDFIFAVIGEEFGFVACSFIIVVYVIMITKAVHVAKTAKDDLGSYIAMGIAGLFFFHMVENIGMTIGLLPITGIPLAFVSYGGSALVTNFICIGLLLNISGRRQKAIFIE
jgi:rod shape determining protein RodA